MPAEQPSLSEVHQPLDAALIGENPFGPRLPAVAQRPFVEPAHYVVPRQFGMSALLGIMTALAVLFGAFRLSNVHPLFYLFFGVQAIVICVAQMLYGKTPRAASVIAGAILLPVFLVAAASYYDPRHRIVNSFCAIVGGFIAGAFAGYATGTLAAGIFLVMDVMEKTFFPTLARSASEGNGR
jgi:putative effector of murein hydrolase